MLYYILKPIIRLTLQVFFRKFDTIGEENLPKNGPAIYVANHPSALMDPLVVAVTLKQRVFFLAGAEWFGKGLKSLIFKKQFNMIPVYRPWLANGKKVSNEEMFCECYKALEKGKSIILFPEASSVTVSKIRELKTGAVRIQSGFEEYMNNKASVPIIPIGISYSNPHKFQSRAVVKVGDPVNFSGDFRDMDQVEIARLKTSQLHEALKETIVHIDNDNNAQLVKQVNRLFIDTYKEKKQWSDEGRVEHFEYAQHVAKAVEHFEKSDSNIYNHLSQRIGKYFSDLSWIGVSDELMSEQSSKQSGFLDLLVVFLGLPIALTSFLIFIIPFKLTKLIFNKKLKPMLGENQDKNAVFGNAFTGSLIFSSGMVVFFLWTVLFSIALGFVFGHVIAGIISLVCCYPIYRFGLYYLRIVFNLRYKRKGNVLKRNNLELIYKLKQERDSIVQELKSLQLEYDKGVEGSS